MSTFLVAVVEDDRSVLESLEDLLESAGYEVILYPSSEKFLASGRLGDIDCLISDIGLPGIDGIELLRVAQASRADLPVIVAADCLPQASRPLHSDRFRVATDRCLILREMPGYL